MTKPVPQTSTPPSLLGESAAEADNATSVSILESLDGRHRTPPSRRWATRVIIFGLVAVSIAAVLITVAPGGMDENRVASFNADAEAPVSRASTPVPGVSVALVSANEALKTLEAEIVSPVDEGPQVNAALIRDMPEPAGESSPFKAIAEDREGALEERSDTSMTRAGSVEPPLAAPAAKPVAERNGRKSPARVSPPRSATLKARTSAAAPRPTASPDADVDIITAIVRNSGQ